MPVFKVQAIVLGALFVIIPALLLLSTLNLDPEWLSGFFLLDYSDCLLSAVVVGTNFIVVTLSVCDS